MNVSLAEKPEAMVRERVESGLYTSSGEVVREALRLLLEPDIEVKLTRLRSDIQKGRERGRSENSNREEFAAKTKSMFDDQA